MQRRTHPKIGFDPNNAPGQDARYRSMQRDLADADSLFLRGPEEREVDSFGQGLGGEPDQSSHVTRTDRANLVVHRGERP